MENREIAKILYEISEYLEMEDIAFKPRAFEKAGIIIESLEQDISEIYKKEGLKGLEKIPTIGKAIGEIIEDLIEMHDYGIGFVLGAPREVDLAQPVRAKTEARASIIKGNDIGISLRGRKSYRVSARPGLSECSELK